MYVSHQHDISSVARAIPNPIYMTPKIVKAGTNILKLVGAVFRITKRAHPTMAPPLTINPIICSESAVTRSISETITFINTSAWQKKAYPLATTKHVSSTPI